jgi:cysteine protease ATG4
MKHVGILSWFADDPHAPFSIHKFVKHGEVSCAKSPGEWFGPAAASRCIQYSRSFLFCVTDRRLVSKEYGPANLRVSVTGDQDGVYQDQVLQLSGDGPMKPTLLLIGKRLGHDNVNPLYYNSLKVNSNCLKRLD